MFKSIRSRLALSFAGIALVAAIVLGAVLLVILKSYYSNMELNYLRGNAQYISRFVTKMLASNASPEDVQSQIENLAFLSQTRIEVYGLKNQLMYDSGTPQAIDVNLGVMKEVLAETNNVSPNNMLFISVGSSASAPVKFPPPDGNLTALPVPDSKARDVVIYRSVQVAGSPFGFALNSETNPGGSRSTLTVTEDIQEPNGSVNLALVKLSEGPAYGNEVLASVARGWLLASLIAILLAGMVGWVISRRISAPVLALANVTRQMEHGDLSVRVDLQHEKQREFISLAKSFNGMAEQVERTVSTLRAFVADAAHELHTPLTALQANLELARDVDNVSERARYLTRAQEQGQRLEALVKSLLDLSRIESAESRAQYAPVDILQLIREMGEQFASRAEQADFSFSMNLPDEKFKVFGNETQLRQVVSNLLGNALKFTPGNGSISLNVEHTEDTLSMIVSDSGIGIPSEDLPRLFERFHRGRNASEYQGNGLGLAIVKAIVDGHRGTASIRSELGQGTVVCVTLPLLKDEQISNF